MWFTVRIRAWGNRCGESLCVVSLEVVSVSAYILVQAEVGTAVDVAEAMGRVDHIVSADVAMGPYDVIARAEASDVDHLGRMVMSTVQKIPGVERTLLCPVVRVEPGGSSSADQL